MELLSLIDLIECLEYGTRLHISIVLLNDFGNCKTELPFEHVIHPKPYCTYMKSLENGYNKCYACRNSALSRAVMGKKAFGGKCINGVYEYVHPVVIDTEVVAVIMVGNVLTEDVNILCETLEPCINIDLFRKLCEVLDSHIKLLDREYPRNKSVCDVRSANLKSFIDDSFFGDISVSEIASIFGYSEKYMGQLFLKSFGMTIKEYVNLKRLERAEYLVRTTTFDITEISSQSGFNNVTYFNRLFKNKYKLSPREYRKSAQK